VDQVTDMAKNRVQFQAGMSLPAFLEKFGDEDRCRAALIAWRWPQGFRCPRCGHGNACRVRDGALFQCHRCHGQTSVTAGTVFQNTRLPLRTWFLAIYLLTQSKNGLSALALKRHLGVSYNTAWLVKHKLMQAMKEHDDTQLLEGVVQLDDAYWGGERRGKGTGRGTQGKTPFVAAVSCTEEGQPVALRMTVVEGFRSDVLQSWTARHVKPGSQVVSDGLACFRAVTQAGCTHNAKTVGSGPPAPNDTRLNWVNTALGNVKNALHGTYHAMNPKHLPRYLAEFCYRFNRRVQLDRMLERLARAALATPPLPYRLATMAEAYG
jgi:transposase-like protein